jgi:hypothetical protein
MNLRQWLLLLACCIVYVQTTVSQQRGQNKRVLRVEEQKPLVVKRKVYRSYPSPYYWGPSYGPYPYWGPYSYGPGYGPGFGFYFGF